ncbi:hypothetical protein [Desulfobulbus elongatus]|uniref:hypothetical protein n=1 Tax=Desulfobulbus elongatus TaxID=53332 RepID=UPI0004805C21|nr:hypothetical protein [Desulfobulbus elongatus]
MITSPLGRATTFTDYSWHGRPGRIVSATGLETVIGYDGGGRISTLAEGNATFRFFYTADGILQRIEGPEGEEWEIGLDAANRMTGLTDVNGNRIEYSLNAESGREGERLIDAGDTVRREFLRNGPNLIGVNYPTLKDGICGVVVKATMITA